MKISIKDTNLTLKILSDDQTLQDILARSESLVRSNPSSIEERWLLFEILCVLGQWKRALKQLQTCVSLDSTLVEKAQALRTLIVAENVRLEVFSGQLMPAPVVERTNWMEQLVKANVLTRQGQLAAADELRLAALEQAPTIAGSSNLGDFEWLSDSDTRLGPICEVIISGAYRWLAFADIARLELPKPEQLLDLVWLPVHVTLRESKFSLTSLPAFLSVRYPFEKDEILDDSLQLARKTLWYDLGQSGVFAKGQKTWMHQRGDWPLLELRSIEFKEMAL